MLRHRTTGQEPEVPHLRILPILTFILLATPLLASNQGGSGQPSPAPEPDTWMLLGSGALVLIFLYTRRRARARSISLRSARSRLKAAG